MTHYVPDNIVILKIMHPDQPTFYRVLAGWSGGYATGSSYKFSSAIRGMVKNEDGYLIDCVSGSTYQLRDNYCLRMNNAGVYKQYVDKYPDNVVLMPEDTNWQEVQWNE